MCGSVRATNYPVEGGRIPWSICQSGEEEKEAEEKEKTQTETATSECNAKAGILVVIVCDVVI